MLLATTISMFFNKIQVRTWFRKWSALIYLLRPIRSCSDSSIDLGYGEIATNIYNECNTLQWTRTKTCGKPDESARHLVFSPYSLPVRLNVYGFLMGLLDEIYFVQCFCTRLEDCNSWCRILRFIRPLLSEEINKSGISRLETIRQPNYSTNTENMKLTNFLLTAVVADAAVLDYTSTHTHGA